MFCLATEHHHWRERRLWCFSRWFQIARCLSWATQHKLHLLHLANFSPKRPALPWGRPSLRTSPWVILGQPHHDHHYYDHHRHDHYYHDHHNRQDWSRWRRPWWMLVSPHQEFPKCLPIQSLPATIVWPIFTISLLLFLQCADMVAMHCNAFCPIV